MPVLETLVLSMPPLARLGLVSLFALAPACTAIIDRHTQEPQPASQGNAHVNAVTTIQVDLERCIIAENSKRLPLAPQPKH
jgi:hypothetical protein